MKRFNFICLLFLFIAVATLLSRVNDYPIVKVDGNHLWVQRGVDTLMIYVPMNSNVVGDTYRFYGDYDSNWTMLIDNNIFLRGRITI